MTEENKHISVAESKVMDVLWQSSPLSAEEIAAQVTDAENWSMGTVKSLLNRLLSKQAISAEKQGRRYLYSPCLARDEYVSSEGQGLLDRLFDGRVSALVTHFSQHEKLKADDIADLKKMIEELENGS